MGVRLTRRMPNKPLFGIRSGLPQSRMPRSHSHTDVDIPLGEFWKTNFGILVENFGEMLEILRTFFIYFEVILWKYLEYSTISPENFKTMKEKLHRLVNFGLIVGKLWRNIAVTLNY